LFSLPEDAPLLNSVLTPSKLRLSLRAAIIGHATTLADSVRRSLGISFQYVFINSLKVVRPGHIHTSQEQLEMITSEQTRLELSRSLKWSDFNGELNMSNPNPVNPTQPPYPTDPNPSPPANETSVQRAEREKREQDQRNR
jgi:hypothetical protein